MYASVIPTSHRKGPCVSSHAHVGYTHQPPKGSMLCASHAGRRLELLCASHAGRRLELLCASHAGRRLELNQSKTRWPTTDQLNQGYTGVGGTRGTHGVGYTGVGGTRGTHRVGRGVLEYSFSTKLQMASDCLSNPQWKDQAYQNKGTSLPVPIYDQYTYKSPNLPSPGSPAPIVNVKLWDHLRDLLLSRVLERGKKLSTGKPNPMWDVAYNTVINLQRRLNTTNLNAMYFFARWDKKTVPTLGGATVPVRTWPIDPQDWDLFTPTGGAKNDFTTHVCMYNVFNALGKVVNSKKDAEGGARLWLSL